MPARRASIPHDPRDHGTDARLRLMERHRTHPVEIDRLTPGEVDAVCRLARRTWQDTYPGIISQQQIDAMLADRYASTTIHAQLADPYHVWLIARENGELSGFAHAVIENGRCKLDKLYVDPERQRRGIGRSLFEAVRSITRGQGVHRLSLQVNRRNARAIEAYRKYGLHVVEARVFDIGGGFVMDDYIMEIDA
jgi:ribosomal protein S18 acetylase RimI-like enzyme